MKLTEQMNALIDFHEAELKRFVSVDPSMEQIFTKAIEYIVTWDVSSTGDLSSGEVIFAFSFGLRRDNTPGSTNKALSSIVTNVLEKYQMPIFAQWEIADALRELGVKASFKAVPRSEYLSTKGVLDQFLDELKYRDVHIKQVVLIAHPDHRFRCQNLLEQAGFSVLVPDESFGPSEGWEAFGCDEFGYDHHSVQSWTRNQSQFVLREIASRLQALVKGDI